MTNFQPVQSREQIAEVARLAREIWPEHYEPIIGQTQVDYMLGKFQSEGAIAAQLREAYEYYIVAHEDRNSGYVAVVPDVANQMLLISKLYVRKSERGHGLGKKALEFVVDLARKRGLKTIWLTVNKYNSNSIAWYGRMGFKNVGPVIADIGDGYVMDDFRLEMEIG